MLADFSKWLITVETAAITAISFALKVENPTLKGAVRAFLSVAIICLVVSVFGATLLLRSLPGIVQTIGSEQSIWNTQDQYGLTLGYSTFALVKFKLWDLT